MKKILILLSVLVIALTFGSAYAKDMSAGEHNGITAFEPVLAPSYDAEPGLVLGNAITAFDVPTAESWAEGAAAGGLRVMEPSMKLENGITIFDTSLVPEPN